MTIRSANINVMVATARTAAKSMMRDFGEINHLQASKKGTDNFFKNTYVKIEKTLNDELSRLRPDWGFNPSLIDTNEYDDNQFYWIVEPLNAKTNFIHGIPHLCISIAIEHQKEVIASVIYDPLKDELFVSEKGSGAYINDKRIRVSNRKNIDSAIFAINIPNIKNINNELIIQQMIKITSNGAKIRILGSPTLELAYVASGRFEGFWSNNITFQEIAAGYLLIKEAGGTITDLFGKKINENSKAILATNTGIHQKLIPLL